VDDRTRGLTRGAALLALTVAFQYAARALPTGQLGFLAASSLFTAAAVIEGGYLTGLLVYLGGSALGALFASGTPVIWLYALFFGYYPIVKSLAERVKRGTAILAWAIKLAVFNAAVTAVYYILTFAVFGLQFHTILIYLAGNAAFALFDIGLSKLIGFYVARISKNIRKNRE
jgi:hypothetical protein